MGGLERGAVYVPGFRRDGRAVPGPDEDAFTLAATALELLAGVSGGLPAPGTVHVVGLLPAGADGGMAALLGHPVDVVPHSSEVGGLREALAAVVAPGLSAPAVVVVVDLGESPAREAMAVALRFQASTGSLSVPSVTDDRSTVAALALLRGLTLTAVAEGTDRAAHPPPPEAQARPWVETSLSTLSEGAYVPRARYLENLPSRWRLEGERCGACGTLTFPARGRCRSCAAEAGLTAETLPRDGARVVAATTIGKGGQPTEFDAQVEALGDYSVVLAEFAPGVRLTLQVTDAAPGEVRIGDRIGTRLRRLYPMEGEWRYGRKAIPLPAANASPSVP